MRIDPGNAAAGVHRSVRSESWGGRSDRGSEDGESCIGWGIHRRVGAEAGAWSSVPAARDRIGHAYQNPEPGIFKNSSSSGVDGLPRISFR